MSHLDQQNATQCLMFFPSSKAVLTRTLLFSILFFILDETDLSIVIAMSVRTLAATVRYATKLLMTQYTEPKGQFLGGKEEVSEF